MDWKTRFYVFTCRNTQLGTPDISKKRPSKWNSLKERKTAIKASLQQDALTPTLAIRHARHSPSTWFLSLFLSLFFSPFPSLRPFFRRTTRVAVIAFCRLYIDYLNISIYFDAQFKLNWIYCSEMNNKIQWIIKRNE